ncbi:uncharacterized protein K452DRAFT_279824 [Aplosporella prunicola CBS 121167]|uniref:Nephrocystin 3-like N-terminal domain-containing protein n=1 Tax=Aplosporella prunicola CBS 121167 TaxID=1176127 RepID=A0A6A6B003_9PEZI|nr:uncharacterized protein K452DRAFT_279824 [Aplosporella prunicola CBS 121167]KAF2136545.1 hypothetical protein K452DRAFT_279824 [Aplosporella prunicola CBS 121167]
MDRYSSRVPKILLQSPAVDFIDNRLQKYHPAFVNPQSQYSPVANSYVSVDTLTTMQGHYSSTASVGCPGGPFVPRPTTADDVNSMDFWDDIFNDAMSQFENEFPRGITTSATSTPKDKGTNKQKNVQDYGIRKKTSWDEVYAQLDASQNQYVSEEGLKNFPRKVYRAFGRHSHAIKQAVNLVPDELAKPVTEAVKIVLEAFEIASEAREEVIQGFSDLHQPLSRIETLTAIFMLDENIRKASINLIVAVFNAIELAIGFFTKRTVIRGMAAIIQNKQYASELRNSLSNIQSCSKTLMEEADLSNMYGSKQAMENIYQLSTDVLNLIKPLLDDYSAKKADYIERMALALYKENQQLRSRAPSPGPNSGYPISKDTLLRCLGIPDLADTDMLHITERKWQLKTTERSRAEQIVNNHKFKGWIASQTSASLLVHGNFEMRNQNVSALSLLCCTLIEAFRTQARFISLVFFCGSHHDDDDPFASCTAMIKSLVAQLLSQHEFNLRDLPYQQNRIQEGNFQELCCLFVYLVRQLPRSATLFCLIDGIVYYEREEFLDGMHLAFNYFSQMIADPGIEATFKLLATSPTRTTDLRQYFPDDWILSMSSLQTSNLGPSEMRVWRKLGDMEGEYSREDERLP